MATAVQQEPTTWDTVRNSVVDSVKWTGRSIQALGTKIAEFVSKVVEWARPFFQTIGNFFAEQFEKGKEIIMQNKQLSMGVGIAVIMTAILAIAGYHVCISD